MGQAPIEVIGVAVVLVGLLLMVMVATYIRNEDTQQLLETSENSIQCSDISSAIARVYSNRGVVKESVHFFSEARIERVLGNPGSVTVGSVTCEYIGSIKRPGLPDLFDTDPGGIALGKGDWCFQKVDMEITVQAGDCS
jgi:hypothetical protein